MPRSLNPTPTPGRTCLAVGALLLGPLLLGGCGPRIVYDFIPPESPEGRTCAAQCANTQTYCRQSAEANYRACEASYQGALASYNACREANGRGCVSPPSCFYPSTSACDEGYRSCFSTCGGRVRARVVE
jgi:hypothetical protein